MQQGHKRHSGASHEAASPSQHKDLVGDLQMEHRVWILILLTCKLFFLYHNLAYVMVMVLINNLIGWCFLSPVLWGTGLCLTFLFLFFSKTMKFN